MGIYEANQDSHYQGRQGAASGCKCSEKAPLIGDVAKNVGWSRLWDLASELGLKAVSGLQMLSSNSSPTVKDSAHATCGMLDLSKKPVSLTTF